MDAFRCACVNVPPDVINERRAARVPLGPGVNLQALSQAAEEVRQDKHQKKGSGVNAQIEAMREAHRKLQGKNAQLRETIRSLGQEIAKLKQGS